MEKNAISKLIKNTNHSLVLELIRSEQPISRAAIAKRLGLSRSTVSSIVDDLLHKKIIIELGLGSSTKEGGRRGIELGFNPKSAYGVGVDIGGTKVLIIITDWDGEVVYKTKLKTSSNVDDLVSMIKESIRQSGVNEQLIIAMGVGVPAITNTRKGIVVDSPALGWQNLPLREAMQQHFSFPVFINNDVRCAALGEKWLGSGGQSRHMVFIAFGTGVGCAIVSNGELIEGHSYSAGEIGYLIDMLDVRNGQENSVGRFGTFENRTSGTALSKHGFTGAELFRQYQHGNPQAVAVIDQFILDVSIAIANICSLLNPEKVVLGGGVSESMHQILDKVTDNIKKFTPNHPKVELARLGTDAGGLGAIAYAFQKIQEANEKGDFE
ncbi:ROK family transcriptional regulator [Brevibacillus sp. SYP-B805]|uniref:ROK family transcriptional regulator n=1 Tax=Brevibacillus sp. SYP-B805 TaxID=1578199 RepID=UPI0013ED2BEE|nr:ROK family transcriptional regulator [Brevibacillus sp. SYP-B805]NGQ95959.1 ROK family transcriptional regulator [Brevibacillus sp. SYP-B805]